MRFAANAFSPAIPKMVVLVHCKSSSEEKWRQVEDLARSLRVLAATAMIAFASERTRATVLPWRRYHSPPPPDWHAGMLCNAVTTSMLTKTPNARVSTMQCGFRVTALPARRRPSLLSDEVRHALRPAFVAAELRFVDTRTHCWMGQLSSLRSRAGRAPLVEPCWL